MSSWYGDLASLILVGKTIGYEHSPIVDSSQTIKSQWMVEMIQDGWCLYFLKRQQIKELDRL